MIDIILMEPRQQKNVGAAARVMKNFGFDKLVLINPKCRIGVEARKVAKHSQEILQKVRIKDKNYLKRYDHLIGTTAILGRDFNINRNPITPKQCAEKVPLLEKRKTGLLIGREGSGLTNEELEQCDILVHIPVSKKYPTLNVSHSLAIILYEFFQVNDEIKSSSHISFASKKEKEVIEQYLGRCIKKLGFLTKDKEDTQRKAWKRIIGKATLTKREAFVIMGFLRKVEHYRVQ